MSSLPCDLVVEILSYLPSKTLGRFRSVSKQFNSFINDPCFIRLHYRRSQASLFALNAISEYHGRDNVDLRIFLTNENNEMIHEFTRRFHRHGVKIIGSDHQFLCFVYDKTISLYDPINREFLDLPNSASEFLSSHRAVSFGFVDSTMQYKVVRWYFLTHDRSQLHPTIVFEVLAIGVTRDCGIVISPWRLSEKRCPYRLECFSPPVHVDGYMYWTTTDFRIVSFSLQDETFSVLPQPSCFPMKDQRLCESESSRKFKLYGIRGKLWVVEYDDLKLVLDIWMMSDEKSYWTKIHHIELKGTSGFSPSKLWYGYFPFEVFDIRSDIVLFQLLHPSLMKCYDVRKKTITHDIGDLRGELQLCYYTDGLLSFKNVVYE